jgi:hypothetical protein
MKLTLGKFTDSIEFKGIEKVNLKKIRISSLNPNKLIKLDYSPLSTNGDLVVYKEKTVTLATFIKMVKIDNVKSLIVLTQKEYNLLLPYVIDYDLPVSVLEQKFPIFDKLKYSPNIELNYKVLINKLIKLKSLNINYVSLPKYFSTKYQYDVERKVRYKNNYDKYFALAYCGGYQEVFKFKEERKDRCVIALDYNSMFVSCMEGDFLKPKKIQHIIISPVKTNLNQLENGLYRVKLKKPKETFFRSFHPFKFTTVVNSLAFKLKSDDCLELLLFKNELEYYSKFFESFEIIEGLVSDETIPHPLYKKARNIYKKRVKAKKEEKNELSNLYKYQLLMMHSSTNASRSKKKRFKSITELLNFLFEEFRIEKPSNIKISQFFKLLQIKKHFKVSNLNNYFELTYPCFSSSIQVQSISAQILANSRIKMLKLIDELLNYPSLEVCYINVDSIHISIEKFRLDDFFKVNKNKISDNLGELKIQAIGNKGYWFDVGRYWIKDNDEIITYANTVFNHRGCDNPFIKINKEVIRNKVGFFEFTKTYFQNINNSFAYSKKLNYIPNNDTGNFDRFSYDDISSLSSMVETILDEKLESKQNKVDVFNSISC